jgi:hypothetical protein
MRGQDTRYLPICEKSDSLLHRDRSSTIFAICEKSRSLLQLHVVFCVTNYFEKSFAF